MIGQHGGVRQGYGIATKTESKTTGGASRRVVRIVTLVGFGRPVELRRNRRTGLSRRYPSLKVEQRRDIDSVTEQVWTSSVRVRHSPGRVSVLTKRWTCMSQSQFGSSLVDRSADPRRAIRKEPIRAVELDQDFRPAEHRTSRPTSR